MSGTRHRCTFSRLLFSILLEVLASAITQQKEIKDIQIGKGKVKFSLFTDDTIFYAKTPKTPKTARTDSCIQKAARYKINTLKLVAFLYTNSETAGRGTKESIPFTITPNDVKYQKINLTKEVKDLYGEKYRKLMKEIEHPKWGTWVAESVKHLTLAQVIISESVI